MCQCVMMIDRTTATLSLMQRQAEFRSLLIGRKMLFRDQTKQHSTWYTCIDTHMYAQSAHISVGKKNKQLSKYLAREWRADKEMWHMTLLSEKDTTKLLNNRTLAWRIDSVVSFIRSSSSTLYLKPETKRHGYKSHDIHASRQFPAFFSPPS